MFPQARVNVLLGRQIVAMPAVIVLGLWIALQLISGVGTMGYDDETASTGGVAYMAHIGGFIAGFLYGASVSWRKTTRHRGMSAERCGDETPMRTGKSRNAASNECRDCGQPNTALAYSERSFSTSARRIGVLPHPVVQLINECMGGLRRCRLAAGWRAGVAGSVA